MTAQKYTTAGQNWAQEVHTINTGVFISGSSMYWFTGNNTYSHELHRNWSKRIKHKPTNHQLPKKPQPTKKQTLTIPTNTLLSFPQEIWLQMRPPAILCRQLFNVCSTYVKASSWPDKAASQNTNYQGNIKPTSTAGCIWVLQAFWPWSFEQCLCWDNLKLEGCCSVSWGEQEWFHRHIVIDDSSGKNLPTLPLRPNLTFSSAPWVQSCEFPDSTASTHFPNGRGAPWEWGTVICQRSHKNNSLNFGAITSSD